MEQVIRDRQNPFVNYSEDEFIDRYRLNKDCVLTILAEIRDSLEPKQKKVIINFASYAGYIKHKVT